MLYVSSDDGHMLPMHLGHTVKPL